MLVLQTQGPETDLQKSQEEVGIVVHTCKDMDIWSSLASQDIGDKKEVKNSILGTGGKRENQRKILSIKGQQRRQRPEGRGGQRGERGYERKPILRVGGYCSGRRVARLTVGTSLCLPTVVHVT